MFDSIAKLSLRRGHLISSLIALVAGVPASAAGGIAPQLPTTVVSAPRFHDVDTEIAARVQLIDRVAIEASGASTIVELLRNEANIHFRSTSGSAARSEISMGGFGENSSQRVLVLLDGQRLNTADLGQINWLSVPLSLVESIEVIKGGQSALYGNNAVGGVIKITTVQPTEELSGQMQASVGSFDSYNFRLGVSGKVGSLGYAGHAEHDETVGYRDNSQYEADGGGVLFNWSASDWFSAHLSVSGVESEYGLPGPLTRAEMAADPRYSKEYANFGEEEAIYYRGGLGLCLTEELSFDLEAGYTERELYTVFYSYGGGTPAFPYEIEQNYEIFSVSPTFTYENGRLTAVFGLDYYDDQVGAVFGTDPVEYNRQTVAAFTSLKYDIAEDWIFSATLRGERAHTDGSYTVFGVKNELDSFNEDQHAWSLGLIKAFDQRGRAYATVRRFYRYPATDEVTVVDYIGATATFNLDLQPEWGYEAELGGDWAFRSVVVGGRIYKQWMQDEIIFNSTIFENVNLDKTSRYGADLFARWTFTEKLEARFDYSYVNAEIGGDAFDGSAVPLVPEHKLRVSMEWQPSELVRIVLGATYTDEVYVGSDFANAESQLSDYVLFDLTARYSLSEEVSVFATVDNLFDKEYVSTAFGSDALYPGVGRSAKAGVTWSF
jgi:iron complex outermembrane receptor protein